MIAISRSCTATTAACIRITADAIAPAHAIIASPNPVPACCRCCWRVACLKSEHVLTASGSLTINSLFMNAVIFFILGLVCLASFPPLRRNLAENRKMARSKCGWSRTATRCNMYQVCIKRQLKDRPHVVFIPGALCTWCVDFPISARPRPNRLFLSFFALL